MLRGQQIVVSDFEGKKLRRRVVEDRGDVILICTEEEFASAQKERREPTSVGFKRQYVADDNLTTHD